MEDHLAGQPWFTGARYGIANIAPCAYTHTAGEIGFANGPAVGAWLDRVRAEPGHVALKPDLTRW